MADLAFEDISGCYYVVDVKTHRESTKFNAESHFAERLARFYRGRQNYCHLMVSYDIAGIRAEISKVNFRAIEFLDGIVTIGALGWGQIQIANSNVVTINAGYSRKKWMLNCGASLVLSARDRQDPRA